VVVFAVVVEAEGEIVMSVAGYYLCCAIVGDSADGDFVLVIH